MSIAKTPSNDSVQRSTVLGVAMLCLAGAIWSVVVQWQGCGTCPSAGWLPSFKPALLGVAAYLVLVGLLSFKKSFRWGCRGLLAAAGTHVVLLVLLIRMESFCLPCVLTGTAALTAAALVVGRVHMQRDILILPLAAMLTIGTINLAARMSAGQNHEDDQRREVLLEELGRPEKMASERIAAKHTPHSPGLQPTTTRFYTSA